MASLAPIAKGWISTTGETGAQNYDEFADDAEITAIVEANPRSMLGVEMAHCTPEMLAEGADRDRSLRYGAERLQRLKDDGEEGVEARVLGGAAAVVAVRDEELVALERGEEPLALGRVGDDADAVLVSLLVAARDRGRA